jgi:hypothetical protein
MIHCNIGSERQRGASGDSNGRGSACCRSSTPNIAAEVIGSKIGNWGVVVCVLADVLVDTTFDPVGSQSLEDVCGLISPCT